MAATVTGSKTITQDVAPHLTAATVTALLATAIENLTIAQVDQLLDVLNRIPKGDEPDSVVGNSLN